MDWSTHTRIADERGPVLEDLFVCRLNMSVRSEHRRDATVKITAKGNFLARGFAMGINDDVRSFTTHLRHRYVEERERIFQDWMHKGARLYVDHTHLSFGRPLQSSPPRAPRADN